MTTATKSTTTIPAQDLADSVGLPAYTKADTCAFGGVWIRARAEAAADDNALCYRVHLTDHQTYCGVLRMLAMWAGDDGEAQGYSLACCGGQADLVWYDGHKSKTLQYFSCVTDQAGNAWPKVPPPGVLHIPADGFTHPTEALAAIIHYIALDKRVRLAIGEDPQLGTLAVIRKRSAAWVFDSRDHGGVLIEWCALSGDVLGSAKVTGWRESVPALNLDMTPFQALEAIAAEVCS